MVIELFSGIRDVPEAPLVIRHTIVDPKGLVREKALADQLNEVAMAQPGFTVAVTSAWIVVVQDAANPEADGLDVVKLIVLSRQGFSKHFAGGIVAVGFDGVVNGYHLRFYDLLLLIDAGDMVGAGKDDTTDAADSGGFIDVTGADDIVHQYGLPVGLYPGVCCQVDQVEEWHEVLKHVQNLYIVGDVGLIQVLFGLGLAQVDAAELKVVFEMLHQDFANGATGASNDNSLFVHYVTRGLYLLVEQNTELIVYLNQGYCAK